MTTRNTSLASKSTVRIAAVSIFVIGVGVVGFVALTRGGSGSSTKPGRGSDRGPTAPPVVNVAEAGPKSGGKARGQLFDPKNPQRVVGAFEWTAFDALGPGRARVSSPRAVIAIGDSLVAVVSATSGELALSARDQPESGTLTGGVPVRFYSRQPGDALEPEGREPIGQFFAQEITFNLPLGELSIPGDFRISTPAAEVRARGLRLLGNQVDSRIELLELEHADYAWFDPSVKIAGGEESAKRAERVAKPRPAGSVPVEVCYSAIFGDNIRIQREQAKVTADGLEVMLRLVDGELPPKAIGQWGGASGNSGASSTPAKVPAIKPDGTDQTVAVSGTPRELPPVGEMIIPGEPKSLAKPTSAAIALRWDGPLTLTPVAERPTLLEENDVAARLFAIRPPAGAEELSGGGVPDRVPAAGERKPGVQLDDYSFGGHAEAMQVVYGASRGDLSLRGGEGRALIGQRGKGHVEAASISLNLGNGLGSAAGPGVLVGENPQGKSLKPAPESKLSNETRAVAFSRTADFRLATHNGTLSDAIEEVTLDGDVQGRDGMSFIEANRLTATFIQAEGLKNAISRVVATGSGANRALAGSDREGRRESMAADRIDVQFEKTPQNGPDGRVRARTVPQIVTAEGHAETRRGSLVMQCGLLEATLIDVAKKAQSGAPQTNDPAAEPAGPAQVEMERVVGPVRIEGGMTLTDSNLRIVADSARADAVAQSADLIGKAIRIERDGGVVTGTQMRLLAQDRSLRVFGPGGFELHPAPDTAATAPTKTPVDVDARWTTGMFVSDTRGRMECQGDVAATFRSSEDETNAIHAAAVNLDFTPSPIAAKPAAGEKSASATVRALLKAEAVGAPRDATTPAVATIESRRFTAASRAQAERVLERVFYVEGERIVGERLESPDSLLTVPSAGRLLIDDRRASTGKAASGVTEPEPGNSSSPGSAPAPLQLSGSKGTSLFSWTDRLTFDRGTGDIVLERGARLLHRPSLTDPVTTLDCERIEAKVRAPNGAAAINPAGGQIELVSVKAVGSAGQAIVQSDGKRLEADELVFDALGQIAEAISRGDHRVSFIDPSRPTPLVAERLYWDLKNNRVTVERPAPIVAPR